MNHYRISLSIAALALLAGCGGANGVRETLGLNTKAPDEYAVYSRPSLTVPPDFNLRAPSVASAESSNVSGEAEKVLLKKTKTSDAKVSQGESALLKKADAQTAKTDIRQLLYKEHQQAKEDKAGSLGNLNPFDNKTDDDPLVDPDAETKRVEQRRANNQPVDGTGSPSLKRQQSAPLEHIVPGT